MGSMSRILPPGHEFIAYLDGARLVLAVEGPMGERYACGVAHGGPPYEPYLTSAYFYCALRAWAAVRERAAEHGASEVR